MTQSLENKMNSLKRIWLVLVNPPAAMVLAKKELESARRSYLENKTHQEYYSNLCSFDSQRIARLEKYIEPNE
jgi:hypothetical protein